MSIDILDRLRAPSGGAVADTQIIEAARSAADEIERLTELLNAIEILTATGFGLSPEEAIHIHLMANVR